LNSVIEPTSRSSTIKRPGLGVYAGREKPRCGDQHGIGGFRVDEVAELILTVLIVASDAHNVAMVFSDEIAIFVDERLPHPRSVFLIDAKHDGLL
jgi:hypothetical protein